LCPDWLGGGKFDLNYIENNWQNEPAGSILHKTIVVRQGSVAMLAGSSYPLPGGYIDAGKATAAHLSGICETNYLFDRHS
jgi:hypothetical protein